MATEAVIGAAYVGGRRAAESNKSMDDNPFYHATEEWDAHRSGWIDRTNQLKKLRPDDVTDQPDPPDITDKIDPAHRV